MDDALLVDARGLEPPEPMVLVLEALSTLQAGQRLVMLIGREPFPLYDILDRHGYAHRTTSDSDGTFRVEIRLTE